MKNFIFILIPLLFLSSCSIDLNNKENKITESTSKILIDTTTQSWVIEKWISITSSWVEIKQIWSGFTLSQTDNETIISYSGKTIKTWSLIPPEKVPFIWDEACVDFFEAMDMVSSEERKSDKNWKQTLWNKFDIDTKKNCMKEYLWRNIEIKNINSRFYQVIQMHYETSDNWIYDIKSENIQKIDFMWELILSESNTWIIIDIDNSHGDTNTKLFYNSDFSKLLSKENTKK